MLYITILIFPFFTVQGYDLVLRGGETQCFGEDIPINTLYVGEISIKDARSNNLLSITVTDRTSSIIYNKQNAHQDKFSFISTADGPHILCIENLYTIRCVISINIKTGAAAKDYSLVPSVKDFKGSELRLHKIKDSIQEIHKELKHIKENDALLGHITDTIQSRVITYSSLTLILLILLAIVQVLYLKKYLKFKKMI